MFGDAGSGVGTREEREAVGLTVDSDQLFSFRLGLVCVLVPYIALFYSGLFVN